MLVYKLDRFSRAKCEITTYKDTLNEDGAKLLSAIENISDSPKALFSKV